MLKNQKVLLSNWKPISTSWMWRFGICGESHHGRCLPCRRTGSHSFVWEFMRFHFLLNRFCNTAHWTTVFYLFYSSLRLYLRVNIVNLNFDNQHNVLPEISHSPKNNSKWNKYTLNSEIILMFLLLWIMRQDENRNK